MGTSGRKLSDDTTPISAAPGSLISRRWRGLDEAPPTPSASHSSKSKNTKRAPTASAQAAWTRSRAFWRCQFLSSSSACQAIHRRQKEGVTRTCHMSPISWRPLRDLRSQKLLRKSRIRNFGDPSCVSPKSWPARPGESTYRARWTQHSGLNPTPIPGSTKPRQSAKPSKICDVHFHHSASLIVVSVSPLSHDRRRANSVSTPRTQMRECNSSEYLLKTGATTFRRLAALRLNRPWGRHSNQSPSTAQPSHLTPPDLPKSVTLRGTKLTLTLWRTECLCCISTKISGLVGAGADFRKYSDGTYGSHSRDFAGLSLRSHGKGNCRTPGRNISSRVSKLAAYGVIEKTRGRTGHNVSACAIIMLRLPPPQPIPFRGSTKPRHTAKPSKIRDVNFFATQRAPS